MARRLPASRIVVVGCSAGGLEPMMQILGSLPRDFPATLFIVQHRTRRQAQDFLTVVLERCSTLPVGCAHDGEAIERGHVYVGPLGHSLEVARGVMHLRREPYEAPCRASIDVLFRSAAVAYGAAVVGVLLSGMNRDGSEGAVAIKRRGGVVIVQDPDDASYGAMPRAALASLPVDACLPACDIARKLEALTASARRTHPTRVLIVEDERTVARSLQARLRALGYVVVGSVDSGAGAIERATRSRPDVVLMDARLPGTIAAGEVASRIRRRLHIPVLYIGGDTAEPRRVRELHAAIHTALAYRARQLGPTWRPGPSRSP